MDIGMLSKMVSRDAALRRKQKLQPVGGEGDKILPPTYPPSDAMKRMLGEKNAPPRHVFEQRRVGGKDIWCVLVDSVQSQANRQEECLLDAIRSGAQIPHVMVDFSGSNLAGVTHITSLDAPHRVYDAILRDSLTEDGVPFMSSAVGQELAKANLRDASALLEISPNALLFGAWHSTGQGGGLGAKFARCLTSEIVAINVPADGVVVDRRTGEIEVQTAGRRTGSRIDPGGVVSGVKIYRSAVDESDWTPFEAEAARDGKGVPILFSRKKWDKPGRPSIINHGNVTPSVQALGITCDHLEHSFVLSFAALRRLRFGGNAEKDEAGRALLAALGMLALTEQDARGYALRSRCDLVCEGAAPLELVLADGSSEPVQIDRQIAHKLYEAAFDDAQTKGFSLSAEPLKLIPQPKLVEIVRKSQELALSGASEGADDDIDA